MTKEKIAANIDIAAKDEELMVVGSDVLSEREEITEFDSCKFTDATSHLILDKPPAVSKASNDNVQPTPPMAPIGKTVVLPSIEEENDGILSQKQIDEAVSTYKLQGMVMLVPPEKYKRTGKVSVSASIKRLRYDLALKPFLLSIPKRPGAHPGKGIPCKEVLVKNLYGLERYAREQIEHLEAEWVEKAIKYAQEYNVPATRVLSFNLKKEAEQKAKETERCLKQAERNQKFAERIENSQKADVTDVYNAAIVDLTQMPTNCISETLVLPLEENALVFVAVMPDNLLNAIDLINKWGLTYVDNVTWNRDYIKSQYVWSKNIHTNILIATKGNLDAPPECFRLNSDIVERQEADQKCLPDYYFSEVEVLMPGGKYLEVFTTRQYSDKWFSYQKQGDQNV